MKKIYDRVVKVQIGRYGQDLWENTSMREHYCLIDKAEAIESEDWYLVFEDLKNRITTDRIYNASVERTRWGGERDVISFSTVYRDFQYRIYEPDKGITIMKDLIGIKIEYVEVKNPTLDFLSKNLSVEDMFEYLRERGIPFCPLYK